MLTIWVCNFFGERILAQKLLIKCWWNWHLDNHFRCDLCRDLIWGLYDTGGTRCNHCDLTCHEKCRQEIRLNCTSYERGLTLVNSPSRRNSSSSSNSSSTDLKTDNDESTLANISTIRWAREYWRGKHHCTIDLLCDWFGISCITTDSFCFYMLNRLIQTSKTGGQRYSDTSPL